MKTIQLYLHSENCREPKLVEVSTEATVADIINKYREVMNLPDAKVDEIELFLEDEDDPKNKGHHHEHVGIKKRHHIHCHRCQKVAVSIEYNGQVKTLSVPPSATGAMILKKAAKEFHISDKDAADLVIKLPDGNVLQKTDHIGSFVSFPHCEIKLSLIHNTQVQG
jgi:hypothetical protein